MAQMSTRVVQCPGCHAKLRVKADLTEIECPKCLKRIRRRTPSSGSEPGRKQPALEDGDLQWDESHNVPSGDRHDPRDPYRPVSSVIQPDSSRQEKAGSKKTLLIGAGALFGVLGIVIATVMFLNRPDTGADASDSIAQSDVPETPDVKPDATALPETVTPVGSVIVPEPVTPEPIVPEPVASTPQATPASAVESKPPEAEVPAEGPAAVAEKTAPAEQALGRAANLIATAKESTVMVSLPETSGTAFCVSSSGLFVTNAHVVKTVADDEEVDLVLHSGTEKSRIVKAKIVRRDTESDLAVLQIVEKTDCQFLVLGDTKGLQETDQILAVGFPFGKALALEEGEFPSVSVNVGRVTSLRKTEGDLALIQIDAQVNPGNSGGPLLSESGKLIGIVQSGIQNSGVHFAIPVDKLRKLVEEPIIVVHCPQSIDAGKTDEAQDFEVSVESLDPNVKPDAYSVEMVVQRNGVPDSLHKMTPDGATHKLKVAFPGTAKENKLNFTAVLENGEISGPIDDLQIALGARKLQLSKIEELRKEGDEIEVTLRSGEVLKQEADLSSISKVEVRIAGALTSIDLSMAKSVKFQVPNSQPDATVIFRVIKNGQKLHQEERLIVIGAEDQDRPVVPIADGGAPQDGNRKAGEVRVRRIDPAAKAPEVAKEVKLPGALTDIIAAGYGRLLVARIPTAGQVAIIDIMQQKVVKYLPLPSDDAIMAGSGEKLILIAPVEGVIQRYDLGTLTKEITRQVPGEGQVTAAAMGHSSAGPLFLVRSVQSHRATLSLLDPGSLKDLLDSSPKGQSGNADLHLDANLNIRASGDGMTFTGWRTGTSPNGLFQFRILGKSLRSTYVHNSFGSVVPSADGKFICSSSGVFAALPVAKDNLLTEPSIKTRALSVPALHGNFYLRIEGDLFRPDQQPPRVVLASFDGDQAIVTLPEVHKTLGLDPSMRFGNGITLDKRLFLSPLCGALAIVSNSADSILIQPFDIKELLDKSAIDFLLVVSSPPATYKPGRRWEYKIEVLSKAGGVKVTIDAAPDGMRLDQNGVISWKPKADDPESVSAILTISDKSGQEIVSTFTVIREN